MTHDYYKQFIPNFTNLPDESSTKLSYQNYPTISNNIEQTIPSSSQNNSFQGHNRDVLVEKLNYMIHLLEEQHDEKTHSVTEEVILYSFLGIFIIFIVDSFSRIGKYTR